MATMTRISRNADIEKVLVGVDDRVVLKSIEKILSIVFALGKTTGKNAQNSSYVLEDGRSGRLTVTKADLFRNHKLYINYLLRNVRMKRRTDAQIMKKNEDDLKTVVDIISSSGVVVDKDFPFRVLVYLSKSNTRGAKMSVKDEKHTSHHLINDSFREFLSSAEAGDDQWAKSFNKAMRDVAKSEYTISGVASSVIRAYVAHLSDGGTHVRIERGSALDKLLDRKFAFTVNGRPVTKEGSQVFESISDERFETIRDYLSQGEGDSNGKPGVLHKVSQGYFSSAHVVRLSHLLTVAVNSKTKVNGDDVGKPPSCEWEKIVKKGHVIVALAMGSYVSEARIAEYTARVERLRKANGSSSRRASSAARGGSVPRGASPARGPQFSSRPSPSPSAALGGSMSRAPLFSSAERGGGGSVSRGASPLRGSQFPESVSPAPSASPRRSGSMRRGFVPPRGSRFSGSEGRRGSLPSPVLSGPIRERLEAEGRRPSLTRLPELPPSRAGSVRAEDISPLRGRFAPPPPSPGTSGSTAPTVTRSRRLQEGSGLLASGQDASPSRQFLSFAQSSDDEVT